jgi:tyrosyl-tRNA synthetase
MIKALSINEKLALIRRNTEEIVSEEELAELLKKKKKPVVYLGTEITGKPHIGYYMWILKLADFLKAGFKVKVLLADLHGALDNTPWVELEKRYNYYKKIIPLMFKSIGIKTEELEFVKGSEFQLKPEYMLDVLKMSTFNSINDCKRAASEVVKFGDNPMLAGLIYPIMQALDEVYLNADVQYGGIDQRKILMFARENLPKIGYDKRIEIMTPLIPGLAGVKMSASMPASKVDLLDSRDIVKEKINRAEMAGGNPNNGVMAFLKYIIMTIKQDNKEKFIVTRNKKYGGDLTYTSYEQVEKDFINKKLHPLDLKNAVADEISKLLETIQKDRKVLEKLEKETY